jgi:cobalt-zinc-cadmium efflux system outer membrane protein
VTRANRERVLRERQAAAARAALAATWSDGTADFDELSGRLDVPIVLPARNELLSASLERHPAVLRADAAIAERAAIVSLARANRIPDVTVAAGARHFNDDDDIAAVFSLSAPLPFFDHNQGALAEAEARLARAREERRSADKALRTALWTAYDQCVAAEEQRALIDDSVLPAANRVLATTMTAYRNGLAPYHEVVDAKRTLYELRIDRIDRLEERYVAAVELERISALTLIDTAKGDPR